MDEPVELDEVLFPDDGIDDDPHEPVVRKAPNLVEIHSAIALIWGGTAIISGYSVSTISVKLAEGILKTYSLRVTYPSWIVEASVETRPSCPKITSYQLRKLE